MLSEAEEDVCKEDVQAGTLVEHVVTEQGVSERGSCTLLIEDCDGCWA